MASANEDANEIIKLLTTDIIPPESEYQPYLFGIIVKKPQQLLFVDKDGQEKDDRETTLDELGFTIPYVETPYEEYIDDASYFTRACFRKHEEDDYGDRNGRSILTYFIQDEFSGGYKTFKTGCVCCNESVVIMPKQMTEAGIRELMAFCDSLNYKHGLNLEIGRVWRNCAANDKCLVCA